MFAVINFCVNFFLCFVLCFSSSCVVSELIYDQFMVCLYPVLEPRSHKGGFG